MSGSPAANGVMNVTRGHPSTAAAPFRNRRDLVDLPFEMQLLTEAFEGMRTTGRIGLRERARTATRAAGTGVVAVLAGVVTLAPGRKQSVLGFLMLAVPAGLEACAEAWRAFTTPHMSESQTIDRVAWDRLSHELVCLSSDAEVLVYGGGRVRLTAAPTANGRGHAVTLELDGRLMATVVYPTEEAERLVAALLRDGLLGRAA